MLEPAETLAMLYGIGGRRVADGKRGRAPHLAGVLVGEVDDLSRPVAHRVV
jgi:hypothetical protein